MADDDGHFYLGKLLHVDYLSNDDESAGPSGHTAVVQSVADLVFLPFWSVRSCLLAYCGVLISVFLFSGLPAICLLVASGPRRLQFTLNFHALSAPGPPDRSHIYSISHTYATYGHHAA